MSLFRRKDATGIIQLSKTSHTLRRDLSALDLAMLGVGVIVGTGIFVLTGKVALTAGPGLTLSFIIGAIACALAALCYAEFSSLFPVSGSAYTYSYVSLGEFVAWIIGWDLVLDYALAAATVSAGWSGYFQSFLQGFGVFLPEALTAAYGAHPGKATYFNLPAFAIVMVITALLSIGIRESKRVNNIAVVIKLAVVVLFIVTGMWHVKPANWQPFLPFGMEGVWHGAAIVFFSYLGFDAITSTAEEVKNPARDLPRGLLGALALCAVLYVIVSFIMTGIVPYPNFAGVDHPVSLALQYANLNWIAGFIDLGAFLGMTTVILVTVYAQTRIFFAMSRDGLLPPFFSRVNEKYRTPFVATWVIGTLIALVGGSVPLDTLAEMVNIGTLSAFAIIALGVIVLRKTQPDLPRKFMCPWVPVLPILSILCCGFLMSQLATLTWYCFIIWLVIGVIIYFTYSRRHALLGKPGA
jgi:APA family basic amino acid/polyamine antiporter